MLSFYSPIAERSKATSSYEEDNEACVEDGAEDAGEDQQDNHSSLRTRRQLLSI